MKAYTLIKKGANSHPSIVYKSSVLGKNFADEKKHKI